MKICIVCSKNQLELNKNLRSFNQNCAEKRQNGSKQCHMNSRILISPRNEMIIAFKYVFSLRYNLMGNMENVTQSITQDE